VDFSDESLILPFATRIHDFGGSIGGFATTPQSRATVQLAGRVDQYGEAKVDGSLSPGDIKQFTDIGVIFRNVTMSSLSPYSATFAGRKIESGKLDLDLQYRIENSQLKSQNKIVLEQFRLGERVESPNATSLPLDLAISLLTDSEGKIQASVPVEGRVDDPKFAYGTVVWDAFATMVTNVVTAPFNALKSVMGNGDLGDPGVVAFDAGSAEVPPPEREKLQKLAAALKSRNTLKLTVHGGSEPKADALALRSLAVRRAVAEQLDHAPAPGGQPAAVNVTDLDSQRALEKLAASMGAGDAVAAAYMKDTGRQPQRVGAMSGLLGRPSTTPDFYERLLADLVERTPVPASELDALAASRAKSVMAELIDRQRFDRQRIALGKPEPAQENGDHRVAIKLELALQ
jgi:outer membrane protein OmpA-like peptidoglycan-associated protein